MNNWLAIGLSFAYILVVLRIASLVARRQGVGSELSRKLVHILVGLWIYLYPLYESLWALILVPLIFVFVNTLSKHYQLVPAMERGDDSWGTVYYAVTLLILSGTSFVLDWPLAAYAGILIMALGDGLAALVGQQYGGGDSFLGVADKSSAGSLTLFAVAVVVSWASISYFASAVGFLEALVLSLLTGVVSVLIELTGKQGIDNLTLPLGASLFLSMGVLASAWAYYLYCLGVLIILIYAYQRQSITLDGMAAAQVTASVLYALGHWTLAWALVVFFILGSLTTKLTNARKAALQAESEGGPRNWRQVAANSWPAVFLVVLVRLTGQEAYLLVAYAVFAAAASDTFASELGVLTEAPVYSLIPWRRVPRGLSGGVSMAGLGFSLLGSLLLAGFAYPIFGGEGYLLVGGLGFLGSVIDSLLGSTLQVKYLNSQGQLQDQPSQPDQLPSAGLSWMTNSLVNFSTLLLVSGLGLAIIRMMRHWIDPTAF